MAGFFDDLRRAVRARRSLLCVGLDPDPERIPGGASGALRHCLEVVRRTADHACCYKPNVAFWEQYGPDGWEALFELRAQIPDGVPVILDGKRADVGNTMRAYARAAFEVLDADAITANPYLGADALQELTAYPERGVYVLCRTSNPGARDLQHLEVEGRPLYLHVADLALRVGGQGNVGLVVGATAPEEMAAIRATSPLPFLVPGVGAQGGDLERALRAAWNGDEASCLVAVGRTVLYADDPEREAIALKERTRLALMEVEAR
ncbi:MAG TPA: orotidine-5'-phosphate decarboxylase [Candidatus Dormibacteraeota bacterium]|nr:orotidine-5'-phosphate decarboxylase [Candidatus Dormibacteraeota bacterium]